MVSKTIRKTPSKSIKSCIRGRKRSSPEKASVVITALHDSFFSCRRRLAKIFSKLARISTTPSKTKRTPQKRKGFRRIKPLNLNPHGQDSISGVLPPLNWGSGTIILDLDETLIHSSPDPPPERYDFVVRPVIDGESMNFYVLKRPGVDQLLEFLSKSFEIVVFTAGLKEYASLVLDTLDPNNLISHRLYRDSCTHMDGRYVKDLSHIGRDLKRLLIVDDNPTSYLFHPHNAIQITPFVNDLRDKQLSTLIQFFQRCQSFQDFREALRVFPPFQNSQNLHIC